MKEKVQPKTLALNAWEREEVRRKLIEVNKKLMKKSMMQLEKESHLLHKIIEIGLSRVDVSESGNIIVK